MRERDESGGAQTYRVADLSPADRGILDALADVYGEGSVLSADLAEHVGVDSRTMGSRMVSLEQRGLVRRHLNGEYISWTLTLGAMQRQPWREACA